MEVAYATIVGVPNIIDFAIAPAKSEPCSITNMIMVDRNIAGNTEKIPLSTAPILASETAILLLDFVFLKNSRNEKEGIINTAYINTERNMFFKSIKRRTEESIAHIESATPMARGRERRDSRAAIRRNNMFMPICHY